MLPVIEPDGARAGRQAVFYAAALLPVSLRPALVGVSGHRFISSSRSRSAWRSSWLAVAVRRARERTRRRARCSSGRSSTCRSSWSRAMIARAAA